MSSNWAEEYSEQVETRSEWRQFNRKQRAQELAKRKALQERDYLHREWRKWHEAQLEKFLAGDYADAARELHEFLDAMDLDSADQLIERVRRGPWLQCDAETRYQVLRMINHAIIYLRESNGYEPFDDPLPEDEPSAFIVIREMLSESYRSSLMA